MADQEWEWKRLAEFLGYTLIRIGPADMATMRRPDGSVAHFKVDAQEMRRLVEALPSPATAVHGEPASPDEPQR